MIQYLLGGLIFDDGPELMVDRSSVDRQKLFFKVTTIIDSDSSVDVSGVIETVDSQLFSDFSCKKRF